MKRYYLILLLLALFSGCEQKHRQNLDGKKLLEQKCSQCHNLDLPPKTFENEKAPPMMAVAFHIKDFIKASNESEKIPKAIDFVKDYVINPSAEKSFCDKKSLESYGVMPSQKGNVTQDELEAIAEYMFEHYTVKNLTEAQALENRLNKMPKGERLALRYNCLGCHKKDKDLVGPSFVKIAHRYQKDSTLLVDAILNGSSGKWNTNPPRKMPPFKKQLSVDDANALVEWIMQIGEQ
jgi:cytochrome c